MLLKISAATPNNGTVVALMGANGTRLAARRFSQAID